MGMEREIDVVIVGGGFAGLSAALAIKDDGQSTRPNGQKPLTYVVLEGEDRLGGRTFTRDGLDFGGGYVGASQNYIQYLIRRFLESMEKVYLAKKAYWLYEGSDGAITAFPGDNPLALPGGENAMYRLGELDTLALNARNYVDAPWEMPGASDLDKISVQDWIDGQIGAYQAANPHGEVDPKVGMSPTTAEAVVASVRSAFSLEPREISFLFMLHYAATAGSFAAIVDVAGGDGAAEATRFRDGTHSLIAKLENEVGSANVFRNAKVTNIDWSSADSVLVTTSLGTWRAKKVIVAMSPPISSSIEYTPALETSPDGRDRRLLCNAMDSCRGRTIKGFIRFKDAFWRDEKTDPRRPQRPRMGYLLSMGNYDATKPDGKGNFEKYPLDWTLDNVWDPSGPQKDFYLMTFIVGDAATYWSKQPKEKRARAAILQVQNAFGLTDAELYDSSDVPANYVEMNWPAGGADSTAVDQPVIPAPDAMMPKNTLSKLGKALRTPVGPLHWAGSESAVEWCGYMNGAIQSGFRSAAEVIQLLRPVP